MKIFNWIILFSLLSFSGRSLQAQWSDFDSGNILSAPDFPPYPGEVDAPVSSKSFRFSTTNDFIGPTDKLVTGGGSMMYGKTWEQSSLYLRITALLITPVFQHDLDRPVLANPIGDVAELQRQQLAYSHRFHLESGASFKLQWNLSYNLVGEHGLDGIQEWIHDQLDLDFFLDQVDPSIQKNYISNELQFKYITSPFFDGELNLFVGGGASDDFFFGGSYFDTGFYAGSTESFRMFFKYSIIKPRQSGFYKGLLKDQRKQAILAFKTGNYYTPSIAYSEVFLKEDRIPQYYLNFMGFAADF